MMRNPNNTQNAGAVNTQKTRAAAPEFNFTGNRLIAIILKSELTDKIPYDMYPLRFLAFDRIAL